MVTEYRPADLNDPARDAKLWSAVLGMTEALSAAYGEAAATGPMPVVNYEDMAAVVAVIVNKMEQRRTGSRYGLFEWTREAVMKNLDNLRLLIPVAFWPGHPDPGLQSTPGWQDTLLQDMLRAVLTLTPPEDFVPAPIDPLLERAVHPFVASTMELYRTSLQNTAAAWSAANLAGYAFLAAVTRATSLERTAVLVLMDADDVARHVRAGLGQMQALGYPDRSAPSCVEPLIRMTLDHMPPNELPDNPPTGLMHVLHRLRYHNAGELRPLFRTAATGVSAPSAVTFTSRSNSGCHRVVDTEGLESVTQPPTRGTWEVDPLVWAHSTPPPMPGTQETVKPAPSKDRDDDDGLSEADRAALARRKAALDAVRGPPQQTAVPPPAQTPVPRAPKPAETPVPQTAAPPPAQAPAPQTDAPQTDAPATAAPPPAQAPVPRTDVPQKDAPNDPESAAMAAEANIFLKWYQNGKKGPMPPLGPHTKARTAMATPTAQATAPAQTPTPQVAETAQAPAPPQLQAPPVTPVRPTPPVQTPSTTAKHPTTPATSGLAETSSLGHPTWATPKQSTPSLEEVLAAAKKATEDRRPAPNPPRLDLNKLSQPKPQPSATNRGTPSDTSTPAKRKATDFITPASKKQKKDTNMDDDYTDGESSTATTPRGRSSKRKSTKDRSAKDDENPWANRNPPTFRHWDPAKDYNYDGYLANVGDYTHTGSGAKRALSMPVYCAIGRITPKMLPPYGILLDCQTIGRMLELKDQGHFSPKGELHKYWPADFDSKDNIRDWRTPVGRPYLMMNDATGKICYGRAYGKRLLPGSNSFDGPLDLPVSQRKATKGQALTVSDVPTSNEQAAWAPVVDAGTYTTHWQEILQLAAEQTPIWRAMLRIVSRPDPQVPRGRPNHREYDDTDDWGDANALPAFVAMSEVAMESCAQVKEAAALDN